MVEKQPSNFSTSARISKQEDIDLKKYSEVLNIGHTTLAGLFIKLGLDIFKNYEKALISYGEPNFETGFKKVYKIRYYRQQLKYPQLDDEMIDDLMDLIVNQSRNVSKKTGTEQ